MSSSPSSDEDSESPTDLLVGYYMSGDNVVQADRDYVAQVMSYYSIKEKRESCPSVQEVVLRNEIQGVTNNLSAENPIEVIFRTAKHLHSMYKHLQDTRADHNNIVVHVKVDDSQFFQVL